MQTSNFVASGALIAAGAEGVRRTLASETSPSQAHFLMGTVGIAMIGAGLFPTDTTAEIRASGLTGRGTAHVVASLPAFTCMSLASLAVSHYWKSRGAVGWERFSRVLAAVSASSAVLMGIGFAAENALSVRAGTLQRIAVSAGLGGISTFCLELLRRPPGTQ